MNRTNTNVRVDLLPHPSGAVRVEDSGNEAYAYQTLPVTPQVRMTRGALGALGGAAGGLALNRLVGNKLLGSHLLAGLLGAGAAGTALAAYPRMQREVAYALTDDGSAGDWVRSAAQAAVSGVNEPERGWETERGYASYSGLPKASSARRVWRRLVDRPYAR